VSTELYPQLSLRMAMKIGSEKEAARVRPEHWLAFFEEAELGATMAIQRACALATKALKHALALTASIPMADGVARIVDQHASAILALRWKS